MRSSLLIIALPERMWRPRRRDIRNRQTSLAFTGVDGVDRVRAVGPGSTNIRSRVFHRVRGGIRRRAGPPPFRGASRWPSATQDEARGTVESSRVSNYLAERSASSARVRSSVHRLRALRRFDVPFLVETEREGGLPRPREARSARLLEELLARRHRHPRSASCDRRDATQLALPPSSKTEGIISDDMLSG